MSNHKKTKIQGTEKVNVSEGIAQEVIKVRIKKIFVTVHLTNNIF